MLARTQKHRALMGGTEAMRAAGVAYLPRFAKESEEAYRSRLASSWLFNGFRKTVRDMVGRVFSKPVELAGADARLVEWCENVDMQGRDLSTFARQVFEDAISGPGVSYIMVDSPRREGVVTQAVAQAQNLRPYMTHLRVEDVLGWRAETVQNVTRLVQLRVMEEVQERDPADEFGSVSVQQVRVLDLVDGLVQVRLFRRTGDKKDWAVFDDYLTDATEITVVAVYANRTGFFTGLPLLDDLADINIAHWQSQSDQRNILHYARVPILFGAGVSGDITIGAVSATLSDDPNAKLQWVEHSGKAIEAGRQDLKDLEFQMETFGLQLLTPRSGAQSATGEMLDANKETSILAMTADQLQDALEQALQWMCDYASLSASPTAQVNKDFGVTMLGAQEVAALLTAVRDGVLSQDTAIREMARRGFIRSDVDPEEEYDRIITEGEAGMARTQEQTTAGMAV
jgi:hypothetical protein